MQGPTVKNKSSIPKLKKKPNMEKGDRTEWKELHPHKESDIVLKPNTDRKNY